MKTIEDLARRWAAAKDEVRMLKRDRNSYRCENAGPGDYSPERTGNGRFPGEPPTATCWAPHPDPETPGRMLHQPQPDDWCCACDARASVHADVLVAQKRLTSLQGALLRAARRPVTG